MTFYIKPPQGCLPLSSVEHMAWFRIKFLEDVSRCSHSFLEMRNLIQQTGTLTNSDYLIEGSPKDITSHFLVRMACAQDREMERFFVQAETELFRYRFACLTHSELMTSLKPLRRLVRDLERAESASKEYRDIVRITSCLTESYDWRTLVGAFVNADDSRFFRLPFAYVLDLVRRRAVHLDRGLAVVPCSKLVDVMTTVFQLLLEKGMALARQVLPSVVHSDCRVRRLFKAVQVHFHKNARTFQGDLDSVRSPVRCEDIDDLVEKFPPCMRYLHEELRIKHRLDHRARIQYTLFLKEIGLPVYEALQFWKKEYDKMPSDDVKTICQHNWTKDSKRYTYSIKHLYGLEGARINYRAHRCQSIQSQLLSGSGQSGCPFRHFDKHHLISRLSLDKLPLDAVRRILQLSTQQTHYSDACATYLKARLESVSPNNGRSRGWSADVARPSDGMALRRSSGEHEKGMAQGQGGTLCRQDPSPNVGNISEMSAADSFDGIFAEDVHATAHQTSHSFSQLDSKMLFNVLNDLSLKQKQSEDSELLSFSCPEKYQSPLREDMDVDDGMIEIRSWPSASLQINKPVDFYFTYKEFLSQIR